MVDASFGTVALGGLVFLAVALGVVASFLGGEWALERRRRRAVSQQLERITTEGLDDLAPGAGSIFRGHRDSEAAWVQALSARLPHVRDVEHLLEQAALGWSVQSYLLLTIGLALSCGLGVQLALGYAPAGLIAGLIGALLPLVYVRRKRKARLAAFEEQLSDTIDLLGRAIRAGHPFSAGLKMVAEESREPIAGEFRRVFEEQRYGLPFEDTLMGLADRVPLVDVRIFVTAVLVQREVGGNLTEILDNLANIIRERAKLQRQVRVLTAEGRMSGYALAALPIGTGLLFYFINPGYISLLFTDPLGKMMVGGALVMQTLGFLWIRKITHIDF